MATLAEQQEFREDINAVATLAVAAVVKETGTRVGPAEQTATLVRSTVPLIIAEYAPEAAAVSADYYDATRAAVLAGAATAYTATLAPEMPDEAIQEALGWALAPLFNPNLNPDDAISRVIAQAEKIVRDAARQTTIENARNDPAGTRYVRVAQPDACAFCRMLATRGADYRSAASALTVVGEIDPRNRDATTRGPRGKQPLGEGYHDHCRCDAIPVFPGETHEASDQVREWMDQYLAVAKATGTKRGDLSALLAMWRELYGTR